VQPRALGSSAISSAAVAASAAWRVIPARANRVRYGPTPPTERAQPARASTWAARRPARLPSRPVVWNHHARSLTSFTVEIVIGPCDAPSDTGGFAGPTVGLG